MFDPFRSECHGTSLVVAENRYKFRLKICLGVFVLKAKINSGKKRIPFLRYYIVFNLEQTEGIEIPEPETKIFHPLQGAEKVIHEMPDAPVIEHNEACA